MKPLAECTEEELASSSYNMYLYSVCVLKNKLPDRLHSEMKKKKSENDEFAIAYFSFLKRKNSIFNKILEFLK